MFKQSQNMMIRFIKQKISTQSKLGLCGEEAKKDG